jgi:hypothetical protein
MRIFVRTQPDEFTRAMRSNDPVCFTGKQIPAERETRHGKCSLFEELTPIHSWNFVPLSYNKPKALMKLLKSDPKAVMPLVTSDLIRNAGLIVGKQI